MKHVPADEHSSSRQRLDLLLRVLFATFVLVGLIPVTLEVRDVASSEVALLPVVLSFAATVTTVVRWAPAVGVLCLSAALVLTIVLPVDGLHSASRILLGFVGFLLVIQYSPRRVAQLFPFVAVLYVGLHVLVGPLQSVWSAFDDAVLSAALTLTGAHFLDVLVNTLARLDEARRARVQHELAESFEASTRKATIDTRHLIHNEVIGTLSAIANFRGLDAQGIRDDCRRVALLLAREVQETEPGETTLASLVSRAARETMVQVALMSTEENPDLDEAQFVALDRAAREGLRNVRRHAGVSEATVSWERQNGSWQLRLTDRGVGARTLTRGWGIANSITKSLNDIGGSAEVSSVPGEGTVVVLTWPVAPPPPSAEGLPRVHAETVRALGDDTSLALKVAVPVLAGNAWLAVRYSWGDAYMAVELSLAAVIVAATFLAVAQLRSRPLSAGQFLGLSAAAAAVIGVGLELAEHDALRGYDSWVIGLSAVALTVSAFYVPLAWALALVTPSVGVVLVAAFQSGLSLGATGGAINAALLPVILGNCFGAYLRWTRATTDTEEARVARLAREAHRRQVARDATGHLSHVVSVAVPWLDAVARGAASLQDPTTRAEAQRLTLEMRDELHLPGVLDPVLRARIALARRRGTVVELVAPDGEARGTGPYLRLLDRALDLEASLERIIIDLPNGSRPGGEVALLPPVEGEQLRSLLRCLEGTDHTVIPDLFSTRIVVRDPVFTGRAGNSALL